MFCPGLFPFSCARLSRIPASPRFTRLFIAAPGLSSLPPRRFTGFIFVAAPLYQVRIRCRAASPDSSISFLPLAIHSPCDFRSLAIRFLFGCYSLVLFARLLWSLLALRRARSGRYSLCAAPIQLFALLVCALSVHCSLCAASVLGTCLLCALLTLCGVRLGHLPALRAAHFVRRPSWSLRSLFVPSLVVALGACGASIDSLKGPPDYFITRNAQMSILSYLPNLSLCCCNTRYEIYGIANLESVAVNCAKNPVAQMLLLHTISTKQTGRQYIYRYIYRFGIPLRYAVPTVPRNLATTAIPLSRISFLRNLSKKDNTFLLLRRRNIFFREKSRKRYFFKVNLRKTGAPSQR